MNLQVFLLIVACVIGVVSAPPKRVSDPLKEDLVGADGTITFNELIKILLALHQGGSNFKIGYEDKLVWDMLHPEIKAAFEAKLLASADTPDTESSGRRTCIGAGFGSALTPSTAPTPHHTADTAKVAVTFAAVEEDMAEAERAQSLARSERNRPINKKDRDDTEVDKAIKHCSHLDVDATLKRLEHLKSQGANFNTPGNLGIVPAQRVVINRVLDERVFAALKECGANFNISGELGMTPAHIAAEQNRPLVLEWLAKYGANLNIKSDTEGTPAHFAKNLGNLECLETLYKLGADFSIPDSDSKTVWDRMSDDYSELTPLLREALDRHLGR